MNGFPGQGSNVMPGAQSPGQVPLTDFGLYQQLLGGQQMPTSSMSQIEQLLMEHVRRQNERQQYEAGKQFMRQYLQQMGRR